MSIPTESIGSIPRPPQLLDALREFRAGHLSRERLDACYDEALRDTIQRFEATGSPVISDGEQTKSSFATYPLQGLSNIVQDGVIITFADGHTRQLPKEALIKSHSSDNCQTSRFFQKSPLGSGQ